MQTGTTRTIICFILKLSKASSNEVRQMKMPCQVVPSFQWSN